MKITSVLIRSYWYFCCIGIAIHEISHLIAVKITPNIQVTDFNILSHVEHEGNYTSLRMFFISYAPLFINTVLSVFLFDIAFKMPLQDYTNYLFVIIGLALGSSIALSSLPSYTDCINPIRTLYVSIFTIKFPLVLVIGPIMMTISFPFIILSYISEKSIIAEVSIRLVYLAFLISLGSGLLDIGILLDMIGIETLSPDLFM